MNVEPRRRRGAERTGNRGPAAIPQLPLGRVSNPYPPMELLSADQIEAILFGQGPAPSDEALEMLLETPVAPERPHALTDLLQGALQAHVAAESLREVPASISPIGTVWHRHLALKRWTLLLDVPDITFRVTRSDEHGGEEVLYSDGFFDVQASNDTNRADLFVYGNAERMTLVARLDNLGKGAAGAAVQCMNVHLGADEGLGLASGR